MDNTDDYTIVYFSSLSENTHRFVTKLGHPQEKTIRIPVMKTEDTPIVNSPYVLIVPTYGGGVSMSHTFSPESSRPVPPQVRKFLSEPTNRDNLCAVIAGGNLNFGEDYGKAGDVISAKFHVPYVYRFELMGTQEDVDIVRHGLRDFFAKKNSDNEETS